MVERHIMHGDGEFVRVWWLLAVMGTEEPEPAITEVPLVMFNKMRECDTETGAIVVRRSDE